MHANRDTLLLVEKPLRSSVFYLIINFMPLLEAYTVKRTPSRLPNKDTSFSTISLIEALHLLTSQTSPQLKFYQLQKIELHRILPEP